MALARRAVLVLGTVGKKQENAGGREALDQSVQERLGFGVDPLQVLKEEQEWPDLALLQHEPLAGLERPLTPLGRIERLPLAVLDGNVQERQECRQHRLQ